MGRGNDSPVLGARSMATPGREDSLCSKPDVEASTGVPKSAIKSAVHSDQPYIGERRS